MSELLLHNIYAHALIFLTALIFLITINSLTYAKCGQRQVYKNSADTNF